MEKPVRVCGYYLTVYLKKRSGIVKVPLPAGLFVVLLARTELFELHDPGLIPDPPGDNLAGVFAVVGFDDGPAAVVPVVAAPFEIMEITCGMDFLDDGVTVTGLVRGFDKITVHGLPLLNNG
jgi:hypothetical protein